MIEELSWIICSAWGFILGKKYSWLLSDEIDNLTLPICTKHSLMLSSALFNWEEPHRKHSHNKDGCLLSCSAVLSGRSLPTFQRSLLPPSLGQLPFVLATVRTSNPIHITDSTAHFFIAVVL
jgi:hypothetical protein